jgi:FkbM family methyltransferase
MAPQARIVAFEPNPLLRPALEKVAAALGNVVTHFVGLGSANEHRYLYTPIIDGLIVTPLGSMDLATLEAPSQINYMKDLACDKKIVLLRNEVEIRPGDGFDLQPTAVKIDVEGFEVEVVRGLRSTLAACRPLLLIERSRGVLELAAMLSDMGYRAARFVEDGPNMWLQIIDLVDPKDIPLNMVFIHNEMSKDLHDRGFAIKDLLQTIDSEGCL